MRKVRTFVDSGFLIAASRGKLGLYNESFPIFDDLSRSFVSSDYIRLETIPKPSYEKRLDQVAFFEEFFLSVSHWVRSSVLLTDKAVILAKKFGLAGMDALHIAAAIEAGCEEFITTEKITKPIHRANSIIRVISIL